MKKILISASAMTLAAFQSEAGGYAEPVYPPELITPMPRPDRAIDDCDVFLWWTICDPANPSRRPGGEGGDRVPQTPEPPQAPEPDPSPAPVPDTPEPSPDPEPVTPDPEPEPGKPHKPHKHEKPKGQNPGNDKPVGKAPYDGERGEQPSGKEKHHAKD